MALIRATSAKVTWDADKKRWVVRIQSGEEVVKRPLPKAAQDAAEEQLRSAAVATSKDEGYELDPACVEVVPAGAGGASA